MLLARDVLRFMEQTSRAQASGGVDDVEKFIASTPSKDMVALTQTRQSAARWAEKLEQDVDGNETQKQAIANWYRQSLEPAHTLLCQLNTELQDAVSSFCVLKLRDSIAKVQVWSGGKRNSSWKDGLSQDARWAEVVQHAQQAGLISKTTAQATTEALTSFEKARHI